MEEDKFCYGCEFMLPDIVRNLDGECCNKKSQFYGKAVVEGTTCDFFEEG